MNVEAQLDLDDLIKKELDKLPEQCKAEYGYHEWVNAYGDTIENMIVPKEICESRALVKGDYKKVPEYRAYYDKYLNLFTKTTRMLPYYVCKHCHAVGNYTESSPDFIKKVR